MGIVEIFLPDKQVAVNYNQTEDLISLLGFIGQQPTELITDLEGLIKLMYSILSKLNATNFEDSCLSMLHNLQNDNLIVTISNTNLKIFVKNKFIFKLLLLLALKYHKNMFIESEETKFFVQKIVQEILNSIDITKYQSLFLLKFLEMILKKREDFLTASLAFDVLKIMNKAAYSPLTGFKNCAQNVSRNILRSLPPNAKKHLSNFYNLPIKGINLNDVLKQFNKSEIFDNLDFINLQILKLFCNNTDSREGSFFYETLLTYCAFDEFIEKIWPCYSLYLKEFDEGEFHQSFLKYWIPITVKHYKKDFFQFISKAKVDWFFQVYTLLETRKRDFYEIEFNQKTLTFLQNAKTSDLALKILCTFTKKHSLPEKHDLDALKFYLNHYFQFEFLDETVKALKQFFSQIFLVSHTALKRNANDLEYINFLTFIYEFCLVRVSNPENCEGASQILNIVWDIAAGSSSDLVTAYKIDRENMYEKGNNLFYQNLKQSGFWELTFKSQLLIEQLEGIICTYSYCPKLIELVRERYLGDLNFQKKLVELPKIISQSICLQSSEKIRIYAELILLYRKFDDQQEQLKELTQTFFEKIDLLGSEDIFLCVLILDILIVSLKYYEIDLKLLEKSLERLNEIFEEDFSSLNPKQFKVLEALINNIIECFSKCESLCELDKKKVLDVFFKIIQVSNMKRPVQLSANFLTFFSASMRDEDRVITITFLYQILNSLYCEKGFGKIRRNPETRLIVHSLCLGDNNPTKPFLFSSLNFMLQVLETSKSDTTLSATLHTLEILVSDNSLHQFTLSYMVDIIRLCIKLFNNPSWIVRNADLQLLKSLIERFLGVSLNGKTRSKTVQDLFTLFPILASDFYQLLSQPQLADSAIIAFLFFSESQIKDDFVSNLDFGKFRLLFSKIIKNYSNQLGLLAIRAFSGLCPNIEIPQIITEIVYYIQENFALMNKNVFASLMRLLQELYHKYKSSLVRKREALIVSSFASLMHFLQSFNCFYFNLLSLKLFAACDLVDIIVCSLREEIDYKKRVWLNNYISYVFTDISFADLRVFLHDVLFSRIPEFLQIEILSVLIKRSTDFKFPAREIINTLIFKLSTISESNYLIMAYSKSILLLYTQTCNFDFSDDILTKIRLDYDTDCIYKSFVYILVLANSHQHTEFDKKFITETLKKYIEFIGEEDEVLLDMSTTIIYLYKVVSVNERYDLIKIIFLLLLNDYCCYEMCRFVSCLTNSNSLSILITFVNLLDIKKLVQYVGEKDLAVKLLLELYFYVEELPEELEESDTYYLIENYSPLSKQYLKAIIVSSLERSQTESMCEHVYK